ncbi:MAG: hypothetical protein HeimC3_46680 [Candidatus Heimdallarchaeota archaeon LC_3]|nr:MAG: hypothetical protein HeimC3_46680 [Candidatus Heimdallarchaeota archaeon LC_3]
MVEIEELLFRYNPWWENEYETDSILRSRYIKSLNMLLNKKDIIFVTGLRRVGKTTILKDYISHLLEKGVKSSDILFVPIDAYGLLNQSIHEIVRIYRKIHGLRSSDKSFLFLDEIAEKENFHIELKDFYDNEKTKIFASSSSASIMKERSSLLTGRSRTIEVHPLDFAEYLVFNKLTLQKSEPQLSENYFEKYMLDGGMPEYVLSKDPEDLQKVIDDIITKDIALKFKIENVKQLKEYYQLLCERVGKRISYTKLSNILDLSRDFVKRVLGYFEDAYLFYEMPYCGTLNEQIKNPKKIYISDVGMRNITTGFRDIGAVYENLVYLTIKHNNPCYILKNKIEIDFKYEKMVIEAKYRREVEGKQKALIEELKKDHQIVIAKDWRYFIKERVKFSKY